MTDLPDLIPVGMPTQAQLTQHLRARLHETVERQRAGRTVSAPEDVYTALLQLARIHETLTDYSRALSTIAKEALGFAEDDLIEAVREQEGVPLSGLEVPDPDGTTVAVTPDHRAAAYEFDLEALLTAVVLEVCDWWAGTELDGPEPDAPAVVRKALDTLLDLGKFEPKITKVRAFADQVARTDPQASKAVRQAGKRKPGKYQGVRITRHEPKRKAG
jgi:hypothetical protein